MHDAYIAGIIDGEGSIMLLNQGKGRSRRPEVSVGMTDENVIDELVASAGGFKRAVNSTGRKDMYYWRCSGGKALDLLKRVRPHLVIERRQKLADIVLAYCEPKRGLRGPGARNARADRLISEKMRSTNAKRRKMVPSSAAVPKRNPSIADRHYLAGILDGEGYVSFEQRRIEVFSTDPELLAWLASRFGGGVYRGKGASEARRPTWRWKRAPTGCRWAAGVADLMLLQRKADELRPMQNFARNPPEALPPAPHPNDGRYRELRKGGVLRAAAMRETGLSAPRAAFVDKANGLG